MFMGQKSTVMHNAMQGANSLEIPLHVLVASILRHQRVIKAVTNLCLACRNPGLGGARRGQVIQLAESDASGAPGGLGSQELGANLVLCCADLHSLGSSSGHRRKEAA